MSLSQKTNIAGLQLLKQNDPAIPDSSGIPRWGCLYRALQAAAEITAGRSLTVAEILWEQEQLMKQGILRWELNTEDHEFWVNNMEAVTASAFTRMGKTETYCRHVGSRSDGYGSWVAKDLHRLDFCIQRVQTMKGGGHYVLLDELARLLWDPHTALQWEPTDKVLWFAIT